MPRGDRAAGVGKDFSANAISLSGLHLLSTIAPNLARAGYMIQNNDVADYVYPVFDDGASGTQTVYALAPAPVAGGQGGEMDWMAMPHSGRILIYGTNTTTKMAAREW